MNQIGILTERRDALEYIFKKKSGKLNELEKIITDRRVEEFGITGMIAQGFNGTNTWKITELGQQTFHSIYGVPTKVEAEVGLLLHQIEQKRKLVV